MEKFLGHLQCSLLPHFILQTQSSGERKGDREKTTPTLLNHLLNIAKVPQINSIPLSYAEML